MEDEQPAATNPVFRASKRRKVFRKKADDGEAGDLDNNLQDPGVSALTKSNQDDDAVADEQTTQARSSHSSAIRRPRNHGINFSSSTAPASNAPERNDETSMVVAPPREPQAMGAQNERFVRPTGKAVVMDDRHMYVASKL